MIKETKTNNNTQQVLISTRGSEFTDNFQFDLFTRMETYTLTPEMSLLLDHLGSLNTFPEINQQTLMQVSTCVRQNVQNIHRWLNHLIQSRSTLSYTEAVDSEPIITITNKGLGTLNMQNEVLELDFPDGKQTCNASTVISCLYMLGRMTEECREYEPFELKDAAEFLLYNGTRLADCLFESAKSMAVLNQQEPDDQQNYHYYQEEYDCDAPAYFRADPRMRTEISYC